MPPVFWFLGKAALFMSGDKGVCLLNKCKIVLILGLQRRASLVFPGALWDCDFPSRTVLL